MGLGGVVAFPEPEVPMERERFLARRGGTS